MALIPYADEDPLNDRVPRLVARLPVPHVNLFTMLANAPALAGPTLRLGEAILTRSDLDPALRELVILHSARLTGTEYEWVQHEAIARLIGVGEEKIQAIGRGEIGEGMIDRDRLAGGGAPGAGGSEREWRP